jgi:hypothetical protein
MQVDGGGMGTPKVTFFVDVIEWAAPNGTESSSSLRSWRDCILSLSCSSKVTTAPGKRIAVSLLDTVVLSTQLTAVVNPCTHEEVGTITTSGI